MKKVIVTFTNDENEKYLPTIYDIDNSFEYSGHIDESCEVKVEHFSDKIDDLLNDKEFVLEFQKRIRERKLKKIIK